VAGFIKGVVGKGGFEPSTSCSRSSGQHYENLPDSTSKIKWLRSDHLPTASKFLLITISPWLYVRNTFDLRSATLGRTSILSQRCHRNSANFGASDVSPYPSRQGQPSYLSIRASDHPWSPLIQVSCFQGSTRFPYSDDPPVAVPPGQAVGPHVRLVEEGFAHADVVRAVVRLGSAPAGPEAAVLALAIGNRELPDQLLVTGEGGLLLTRDRRRAAPGQSGSRARSSRTRRWSPAALARPYR